MKKFISIQNILDHYNELDATVKAAIEKKLGQSLNDVLGVEFDPATVPYAVTYNVAVNIDHNADGEAEVSIGSATASLTIGGIELPCVDLDVE